MMILRSVYRSVETSGSTLYDDFCVSTEVVKSLDVLVWECLGAWSFANMSQCQEVDRARVEVRINVSDVTWVSLVFV